MGYTFIGFLMALLVILFISMAHSFRKKIRLLKATFCTFNFLAIAIFIGFSVLESTEINKTLPDFAIFGLIGTIGVICTIEISLGFYIVHVFTQDLDESIADSLVLLETAGLEALIFWVQHKGIFTNQPYLFFSGSLRWPYNWRGMAYSWDHFALRAKQSLGVSDSFRGSLKRFFVFFSLFF